MNFLNKVRFRKSIDRVDPTSVGNTSNSVSSTSLEPTKSNSVSSTSLEPTTNQILNLGEPYDKELPFNREGEKTLKDFFGG